MKISIIGAGNMGGAIARALVGIHSFSTFDAAKLEITLSARSEKTLSRFPKGFKLTTDNKEAASGADIVIFAVKPWMMEDVLKEVAGCLSSHQIIVSVAAGLSFNQLSQWLCKDDNALFRVIPNTAIEIGSGVTFVSSSNATDAQKAIVMDIFARMGYALEVDESMMAAGTALASCGIAYAMKYIQASALGGESLGFTQEQACRIVEYTVKGAAELLLATGNPPQTEIDKVTTPGGMTEKGLASMEASGFTQSVQNGLDACLK